MKNSVQAIILAAGKSTRFNTEKTKLAEPICGQPMILFSTKLFTSLDIDTTVIVGHEKENIQNIVSDYHGTHVTYALQEEQLGTGHALACSQPLWNKEHILVINADMPLITADIINDLFAEHQKHNATVSFVTACTQDQNASKGYGRVVVKDDKIAIVEAKDFIGNPAQYCCINAGIYLIKKEFLCNYIKTLNNNNANNEFYITDLIKIASEHNLCVTKISAPFDTIRGINTIEELYIAEQIKRTELIHYWMNNGVRFAAHDSVQLDITVSIGQGSFIGTGVHLSGKTTVGKNTFIAPYSFIKNSHLHDNVHLDPFCVIKQSVIGTHAHVGPFAHIQNNVQKTVQNSSLSETHNNTLEKSIIKKIVPQKSDSPSEKENEFSFIAARLVHHDIPVDEQ